jgi:hypothetical protein
MTYDPDRPISKQYEEALRRPKGDTSIAWVLSITTLCIAIVVGVTVFFVRSM